LSGKETYETSGSLASEKSTARKTRVIKRVYPRKNSPQRYDPRKQTRNVRVLTLQKRGGNNHADRRASNLKKKALGWGGAGPGIWGGKKINVTIKVSGRRNILGTCGEEFIGRVISEYRKS